MTKEEALEKISEYSNAFKNMFSYHNDKEVALAAAKRNGLVLDCCSKDAIELDTAKNTRGTTLTKRRFRNISPNGFINSTKPGAIIPIMLPIVIPSSKNKIPE